MKGRNLRSFRSKRRGKSTTIKMITTLLPPTRGHATVGGFDLAHDAGKIRRLIGYVPQILSADGTLTGRENLLVFSKLYDIPKHERVKRIDDSLEFMGLAEACDKMVKDYSGGMIRRLEIAQSMLSSTQKCCSSISPRLVLTPWAQKQYGTTSKNCSQISTEPQFLSQPITWKKLTSYAHESQSCIWANWRS